MIRIYRFFRVFLALGLIALWSSCSSRTETLRQPRLIPQQSLAASTLAINREERSSTKQQYIPVYRFAGDDWTPSWKPRLPEPAPAVQADNGGAGSARPDTSRYGTLKRTRGYRVQLANITDEARAKAIEKRAHSLFKTVYIFFQSPSYKVRAGDYTHRADADAAANEARRMGFRGAWVVPDQVNIYVGGPPPPQTSAVPNVAGSEDESPRSGEDSNR